MKLIMKLVNNPRFILFIIVMLALLLRTINLKDNIIIAYDQARDGQRVMEIIEGKLKIVGPETDIPGVFNGPLFYYLLTPIYALTNFNLNLAALVFIIINVSGVLLIYYASSILFGNRKIALLSAFLWAISYEQLNFARFISNASPMSISTIIFFLGIAMAIFRKKEIGLLISVVGLAAAIHFNFYLVYLVIFYPIFFLSFKYRPTLKISLWSSALFVLLISSFLVAEIKWQFMAIKSLLNYVGHQSSGYTSTYEFLASISGNSIRYYDRITEAINYSLLSYGKLIGFCILFIFIELIWKNRKTAVEKNKYVFLYIWLFSTFPLFFFKSGVLYGQVINSSIFAPLTIIFAAGLYYVWISAAPKSLKILLLLMIVTSNFALASSEGFKSIKLFATQPLTLATEKNLIDYSYNSAQKKPFSICALTNPLFMNTLWSFLYTTYGKNTYGYVPDWSGQKQVFNKNYLPDDRNRNPLRYLIIEPPGGIPDNAKEATIYLEDKVSLLIEEKKFGDLTIQKRMVPSDKSLLKDSQKLSNKKRVLIEHIVNNIEARYHCSIDY